MRVGGRSDCGKQTDRPLAGDDTEMPGIRGQDRSTISLGTRDHGSISQAERKILVPSDQLLNAFKIALTTIQGEITRRQITQESDCRIKPQPGFEQIAEFSEGRGRNKIRTPVGLQYLSGAPVVGITAIGKSVHPRCIEGNHAFPRSSSRYLSHSPLNHCLISLEGIFPSAPIPIERGRGRSRPAK